MELKTAVKKVFPRIEKRFDEEGLKEFLNTPIDDVIQKYLFLSTWIRLFVLKPNSKILNCFKECGFNDINLIADVILIEFYKYKQQGIN